MENRAVVACRPDIDRRQALSIEALRFAIRAALFEFERIVEAARRLEGLENPLPWHEVFPVLVGCWSAVDALDRANDVLQHTGGLKTKWPWVGDFKAALEPVRDVRNGLQHLHSRISQMSENSPPTLGALSWIDSRDKYTVVGVTLSSSSQLYSIASLPFDRHEMHFVRDFTFSHDKFEVSLSDLMAAADRFSVAFEDYLLAEGFMSGEAIQGVRFQMRVLRDDTFGQPA